VGNILVINSGSSSIRFQIINSESEDVVLKGKAEKLRLPDGWIAFKYNDKETKIDLLNAVHTDALNKLFEYLDENGLTKTLTAVGHRVVHGGEKFTKSTIVTPEILEEIKKLTPLAPLHNPANIMGIEAITEINPDLPQVAVFDTAFHSTMPPEAYRYSVPEKWYKKHGVRRYGFHGTSYAFIAQRIAKILDKPVDEVNLIVAHIGSGASISAIRNGKSVSNTMGFTPLAGLPMGTRSGNIDPGIIPFIMERENLAIEEVITKLNKESGHIGTSKVSDDTRDVITAADEGNEDAVLAIKIFDRKIAKYIAGFMTMLPSLDALIFTAGNGENRNDLRADIVKRLEIFDFKIDEDANDEAIGWKGKEGKISADDSKYPIYALATNEELMIAKDTAELIK
jgi:acetate kinase